MPDRGTYRCPGARLRCRGTLGSVWNFKGSHTLGCQRVSRFGFVPNDTRVNTEDTSFDIFFNKDQSKILLMRNLVTYKF